MSTDPNQPTGLPVPDPAAGTAANEEAGMARQDALRALNDGTLTLRGLFDQGANPGPVGHMNVKAALIALPGIDQVRADAILEQLQISPSANVDQLGTNQQTALINAVGQQ